MPIIKSPQLVWLRSFEAVMRHQNATKAASELNLTQGAISQHIRKLETLLATPLFIREGKSMLPSNAGFIYRERITPLLDSLDEATLLVSNNESLNGSLTISIPTSFGMHWLIKRLPDFRRRYPEIQLHILNRDVNFNHNADRIDLCIEFQPIDQQNKDNNELFFYEYIIPVCSPNYAKTKAQVNGAEDLLEWDLLLMDERFDYTSKCWWDKFLNVNNTQELSGYRFERHSFVIEAAISDMGVGFVPQALVADELSTGVLIQPLEAGCLADEGLVISTPHYQTENVRCRIFKEWLTNQASDDIKCCKYESKSD